MQAGRTCRVEPLRDHAALRAALSAAADSLTPCRLQRRRSPAVLRRLQLRAMRACRFAGRRHASPRLLPLRCSVVASLRLATGCTALAVVHLFAALRRGDEPCAPSPPLALPASRPP
jgi:hypothetical protein